MITPEDDTIVSSQRQRRRPKWLLPVAAVVLFALGILIGTATGSTPAKAPAAATPAPAVTVTQPGVDTTETVTATPQPQPGQVLLKHSGSGNWNSAPFEVSGDSPQLKVTYTFHGNTSGYGGDNFIADITNGSDDQGITNEIATSGGKTTMIYPDTTFGGGTSYHLEVQATGPWSFTITEVS